MKQPYRKDLWPPEHDEIIRREYRTVANIHDLADRLGCSVQALKTRAHRMGVRRYNRRVDDDLIRDLRRDATHMTRDGLCRKYGVSLNQIHYHGIKTMKRGEAHHCAKHPDDLVERCLDMADNGFRQVDIAKKTGVHPRTVRAWVNFEIRTGIPVNA